MTPEPGVVVAGRYQLERCLASGGMGTVWVATHLELETEVAIKFMDASMSNNEEWRARFDREAKAAASLRSAHVVQILDYGSDDDVRFIVMELLTGESLRQRIKRLGRLSLEEASQIVWQVCKALALATKKGVIHRDLKPGNIFLAEVGDDEIVKVLDFGVAKDHRSYVGVKTATGQLVGSPHYMSPEQARGTRALDHRSDVWSLAVIIYEMLTGVKPFQGDVLGDIIIKIYTEPAPPPSAHVPELPPEIDQLFERALDRDIERRFQSARELADDFAAIVAAATGRPAPVPSQSDVRSRPTPAPQSGSGEPSSRAGDDHVGAGSLTAATLKQPRPKRTKRRWGWYTLLAVEVGAILLALLLAGSNESTEPAQASTPADVAAEPAARPAPPAAVHATTSPSASADATKMPAAAPDLVQPD